MTGSCTTQTSASLVTSLSLTLTLLPAFFIYRNPCDLIGPSSYREASGWGRGMAGTNYWVLGRWQGGILQHKEYSQYFVLTLYGVQSIEMLNYYVVYVRLIEYCESAILQSGKKNKSHRQYVLATQEYSPCNQQPLHPGSLSEMLHLKPYPSPRYQSLCFDKTPGTHVDSTV